MGIEIVGLTKEVQAEEVVRSTMSGRLKLKTTPERSLLMSKVRHSGTSPEVKVRRLLHALGYRFRIEARDLPGSPDIVNRSGRWAIFVHGCFWHAHEKCRLWTIPKSNQEFWIKKFEDNRNRDRRKLKELSKLGYSVLIIWQCDLKNEQKLTRKLLRFKERSSSQKILKRGLHVRRNESH